MTINIYDPRFSLDGKFCAPDLQSADQDQDRGFSWWPIGPRLPVHSADSALSPVSTQSFWPTATPAHPAQSVLDHTCFPPHLSPIFDQSVFVYSGDSLCPVSWHKDIITAGSKHSVILLLRGETLHFTLQLRRTISHLILYQVIKIFKYDCP